jgi:antitoxin component YwqK of YwqJK toxin-antitoxin module
MPLQPNLEELCEQSKAIICGELIMEDSRTQTVGFLDKVKYRPLTFKVHKVFKGNNNIKEVKVLIPIERRVGCSIKPIYKKSERYFLFLKKRLFSKLYMRIKIDDIWGERKWSKNKEQELIEELKFLSDPDKWKKHSDNLSYVIPKDANEKLVELTEYQKKHKFSKRGEYWLNGKLVGERAWYENGQIAYEKPIKNNIEHGICRAWYPDGEPFEVRLLRKNRLHGIQKQWDGDGNLDISYWIRGKPVGKRAYLKASKTNATLPKYEDNRPIEQSCSQRK